MAYDGDSTSNELSVEQLLTMILIEMRKQTLILNEISGLRISNNDIEVIE